MDNAPDSGPAKKPTPRTNSRPAGTRKPPPVRKPAARKPAAKPPVVSPPEEAVAEELGLDDTTVLSPRDAELREEAANVAADEVVEVVEVEPEVEPEAVAEPEQEIVTEPEPEHPVPVKNPAGPVAWARGVAEASRARTAAARELRAAKALADEKLAAPEAESETVVAVKVTQAKARAAKGKPGKELFPDVVGGKKGSSTVLSVRGLTKSFDDKVAVAGIDLEVKVGAFYGIVGPNGAGKTTTLSMITGLLRPDSGTVVVNGSDVWTDTVQAKRMMGVLPDRLRLFDRLTGGQLLYYAGVLRGLDNSVVRARTADLANAFGLEESLGRLVSDYSAGMTKKIALAAAMIHSPRLLVLDEPFESVDPVSAATVTEILKKYVAAGGTVVLSSHSMDLVQRICDHVAVVVRGELLADGTMAQVRDGQTLEERFVDLAGGRTTVEGLEWLHSFSD